MAPEGRLQHLATSRPGWIKVIKCCERARRDGHEYIWVDTCCINKYSSAELQEAINSMFRWYANAQVCYAYLSDVMSDSGIESFMKSQWFTRGWTLQELLAPKVVELFDRDWVLLGTRHTLADCISQSTRIARRHLSASFADVSRSRSEHGVCIAEIMSWAVGRKTSRPEDRAYSLLGLFDVSMPMLYGEGDKAFIRLQEQILSSSNDQSLFAWRGVTTEYPGLLAKSPDHFQALPFLEEDRSYTSFRQQPSTINNEGITSTFYLRALSPCVYRATLNICSENSSLVFQHVAILIRRVDARGRYIRIQGKDDDVVVFCGDVGSRPERYGHERQVNIVRELHNSEKGQHELETGIPHISFFKHALPQVRCRCKLLSPTARVVDACLSSSNVGPLALFDYLKKETGSPWPFHTLILALDDDFVPTCTLIIDPEDGGEEPALHHHIDLTRDGPDDSDKHLLSPKFSIVTQYGGRIQLQSAGILSYKPRLKDIDHRRLCNVIIDIKGADLGLLMLIWTPTRGKHKGEEDKHCWNLHVKAGDDMSTNKIGFDYKSISTAIVHHE